MATTAQKMRNCAILNFSFSEISAKLFVEDSNPVQALLAKKVNLVLEKTLLHFV